MTLEACESKLRSVVRSSMHPCPGNWLTVRCTLVYRPGQRTHLLQELNVISFKIVLSLNPSVLNKLIKLKNNLMKDTVHRQVANC